MTYKKKIFCICDSALGGWLLKKLKLFEVITFFEFSQVWENVEYWLVYANKLFWIVQPYLSTDVIKWS